jgi:outer membrane protein
MNKAILFILLSVLLASCKKEKVAYMDIKQVFDEFKYKQDLEKELTGIKNKRKFSLDSMETNLRLLSKRAKADIGDKNLAAQFDIEKELYLKRKYMLEEEEEQMVKTYDAKIISQLNSYVKEYGKKNNYSLILGANSDGNIMYSDTTLDISKDIIKYINNKYEGN